MMDIGKDLQDAYECGRQDALNELMEYTYAMLTAEKFGLQHKIKSMMADRKTEPINSEKPNNCELQTIRCPKCGRTDYIRDMEKDMGIKGSHYKYKCINCNTYIKDEPTISKMEQVDKDINVRSKTEPQTEREGE